MFRVRGLPRSLGAALRDATDVKAAVRVSALGELGRFNSVEGRQVVLEQLVRSLLSDSDHRVRSEAAVALADFGASGPEAALLQASRDDHPRVRQMALLALGELGSGSVEVVSRCREACADPLAGLRFQGLIALVRVMGVVAASELLAALHDEDGEVRYIAVRLIEEHIGSRERGAELSNAVRALLVDPDPAVRLAAALVSARDGVPEASELIVDTLNARAAIRHADDEEAAIGIVGDLALVGAIPGLRRRVGGWLIAKPFDWLARVALCQLGDPSELRRLDDDLGSSQSHVRARALAAVARGRVEQARPLVERMAPQDDDERAAIERALAPVREA